MTVTLLRSVALACLLLGVNAPARAYGIPSVVEPELTEREHARLKTRLDERWRVVPTREGLLLVPRQPSSAVKGIELSGTLLYADGRPVSGADLYRHLGADAESVLELSYLTPAERAALFPAPQGDVPVERPRAAAPPVATPESSAHDLRYTHGARVRVGGSVTVREDEQVSDAVAVFGGAEVRGLVTGNLVTVGGDIKLGPKAVVRGNVVSIGGRVEAEPGALVSGDTSELSPFGTHLRWWDMDAGESLNVAVRPDWPRIARVTFYAGFATCVFWLVLCASVLAMAPDGVARARAEMRGSPVAAFLVGLMVQLLIVPVLLALGTALSLSIIGIPLLAVLPLIAVIAALGAVVGFTGIAQALGEVVTGRRMTRGVALVAGLCLLWGVGMTGRYLWMASNGSSGLALLLAVIGLGIEGVAWTLGIGGATMSALAGRRPRTAAAVYQPPPVPEPPSAFSEL